MAAVDPRCALLPLTGSGLASGLPSCRYFQALFASPGFAAHTRATDPTRSPSWEFSAPQHFDFAAGSDAAADAAAELWFDRPPESVGAPSYGAWKRSGPGRVLPLWRLGGASRAATQQLTFRRARARHAAARSQRGRDGQDACQRAHPVGGQGDAGAGPCV